MKKFLLITGLAMGLLMLMSSQCNNSEPVNPDCNGIITATATGFLNQDFCFDVLIDYNFENSGVLYINASQDGDINYAFSISLDAYNGPGTYGLGEDQGFAELIVHGNESEFYKVQTGTITVSQADETSMKATFYIETSGFYNKETVNFSGTVDKK